MCEGTSVPAVDLVEKFLSYLRAVVEENGEWKEVCAPVERMIERRPGATR